MSAHVPGSQPHVVTNATQFVGVIGLPVRHSLSPVIHNAAYEALGIDWTLGAFEVAGHDVASAILGARSLGFRGLAVTMPHKEAAATAAEQLTPRAERLHSANTITFHAGVAVAESTDGEGLIDDLAANADFDPSGTRCAVIGAGGAARSVILSLAEHGASEILIVNRTEKNARNAAALAPEVARIATMGELGAAAIVVNATPIGMSDITIDGEWSVEQIASSLMAKQLVVDLIYSPEATPFLGIAKERGAIARNGLGMLICQAARQIELWTGHVAPTDVMWDAAKAALGR